jgi:hypothetical protein
MPRIDQNPDSPRAPRPKAPCHNVKRFSRRVTFQLSRPGRLLLIINLKSFCRARPGSALRGARTLRAAATYLTNGAFLGATSSNSSGSQGGRRTGFDRLVSTPGGCKFDASGAAMSALDHDQSHRHWFDHVLRSEPSKAQELANKVLPALGRKGLVVVLTTPMVVDALSWHRGFGASSRSRLFAISCPLEAGTCWAWRAPVRV